jgi:hypothetical protein
MKLAPGERSILARFAHGPEAEQTLMQLKEADFAEVQMDRIGKFGVDPDVDMERPAIAGDEPSLAAATLEPAQMDDNTRILMAAMPEASGMAGPYTADQTPFLVTVLTHQDRVQEAVRIIEENGGRV